MGKNSELFSLQIELEEVDGMDTWLYLGESIEKKLDQLELEGERINLMEFSEEK